MKDRRRPEAVFLFTQKIFKGSNKAELIGNISSTFITQVLTAIASICFSIVVSRTLGVSGQGKYALIILLSSLLAQFLDLGIPGANIYYIGRKETTPEEALQDSLFLGVFLVIIGGFIGIAFAFITKNIVFEALSWSALVLSIAFYSVLLLRTYSLSILQGSQKFLIYNIVILTSSIATLLLGLVSVSVLGESLFAFVISSLLGNLLALILCLLLTLNSLSHHGRLNIPALSLSFFSKSRINRIRRNVKYGWKVGISNIVASLNYRIDIILISYFLGVKAVGIYVIAVQIAEKLWFFSQSASTVALPKLTELYASTTGEEAKDSSLTPFICKVSLLFTLISSVTAAGLSPKLVPLLFGIDFQQSVEVLFFLLPGVVLLSISRILANDIAARGYPEFNLYSSVLVLLVNVFLNVLLIERMGVVGAAIATSISYFINVLLKLYVYVNHRRFEEGA